MSKKVLYYLLIFSVIINISAIGTFSYYRWFKTDFGDRPDRNQNREDFFKEKLGLSDEQSEQMKKLRESLKEDIAPFKEQLTARHIQFANLMKQDSVNTDSIYILIDEISDIQKQIQIKITNNMFKQRTILTPQQRDIFHSMVSRHMRGEDRRRGWRSKSNKTEDKEKENIEENK